MILNFLNPSTLAHETADIKLDLTHTSLDRRKDSRPVKFFPSFKVAFLALMDFRTQWNIYQMKAEDLGLRFLLVFWMDIH